MNENENTQTVEITAETPSENQGENQPVGGPSILDQIKEIKENTVSRQEYEKAQATVNELTNYILNGGENPIKPETIVSDDEEIKQLRHDLYSGEVDLLDYEIADKTVKLRKALLAKGEQDPMLPFGSQVKLTDSEYAEAKKQADKLCDVFEHCVGYCEGDNAAFINELQRLTVQDTIVKKPPIRRN